MNIAKLRFCRRRPVQMSKPVQLGWSSERKYHQSWTLTIPSLIFLALHRVHAAIRIGKCPFGIKSTLCLPGESSGLEDTGGPGLRYRHSLHDPGCLPIDTTKHQELSPPIRSERKS
jgi:hypothetical protein